MACLPLQVLAESIEACMREKAASLKDPRTEVVISDQGCTTGGTEFVVQLDFHGYKVSSCRAEVCYPAPPQRIITDAKPTTRSAAGSNNGYDGPHFTPDRERASKVCFNVWARGPDKDLGARGWQKLDVAVATRRVFSDDEMIAMATTCAVAVAKQ